MGRILAIDYGRKRCGIAVSDPLKLIANGLKTVATQDLDAFFEQYLKEETVDLVVVGLPKQLNNEPSEAMSYIEPYVRKFKKKYPEIPLVYSDERFTSVLAHKAMLEGGLKKKDRRNKALADEVSATILLQDYMEFNK
ncbi:MAG: Holliday junction resolvase RuvX [Bacteroidales bacterium]|jgi:putative Holliday junction resolvase|nr:Holliday junction resolvase RuvX [Bacteroidales bacterium]MDI9545802.1 Holliday junction resolvase RuvX [Bacteroidota bacterium]OQC03890.1 MAG: putative Holliday junction resolvase [Bacteroidetes bacterium ADurb.Bin090]MBP8982191.1 Holliday junction resolvase RuvX [Bacteroidales bacterium]NLV37589.1 Holliday junction resolvase RuvX [Bacteroidales bacterium]